MNKKNILIIVLVILAIAAATWFILSTKKVKEINPTIVNQDNAAAKEDSVATINSDLNGIDVGSIDAEFQSIDKDLQGL